jgi:hypothetical protein
MTTRCRRDGPDQPRPELERVFSVDLNDAAGTVNATVEKVIHISRREHGTDSGAPSARGSA